MSPTAASGQLSIGSGRPGTWSALTRISGVACLVGVVGVALLGALFSSAVMTLVVAPVAGIFGAGQLALVHPSFPGRRSARRAVLLSGFGWAVMVPFVMGAVALGVVGAVLTVVLVLIGALLVVGAITDVCRRDAVPDSAGASVAGLEELVSGLPTATLLAEWEESASGLGSGDPGRRAAAIQFRGLLLAEMTRRDPAGVDRWLREGTGGTTDPHLPGDSDSASR